MNRSAKLGAIAVVALAASGAATVKVATSAQAAQTITYYAFNINNGGIGMNNDVTDPGFFAAPGTNPSVLSQGDQMIVNDQLTGTHKTGGGYAILGYDAGLCTMTRVPDPSATTGAQKGPQTLEDCNVTAMLKSGSLVVQGVITYSSHNPEPSTLAIIGGTGAYDGASGTVRVSFGKTYNTYAIDLR